MTKTKKKLTLSVVLVLVASLLVVQVAAAFTNWHTFRLPAGSGLNNGATQVTDQNGIRLQQRTGAINAGARFRRATVGSQGQTMTSNPQVRVVRQASHPTDNSGWVSAWRSVSNNSSTNFDQIPLQQDRIFHVEARSASNQIGTQTASFRLNVNVWVF